MVTIVQRWVSPATEGSWRWGCGRVRRCDPASPGPGWGSAGIRTQGSAQRGLQQESHRMSGTVTGIEDVTLVSGHIPKFKSHLWAFLAVAIGRVVLLLCASVFHICKTGMRKPTVTGCSKWRYWVHSWHLRCGS